MNQVQFIQKIDNAQNKVAQILGHAKNPQVASKVEHSYDDKYLLAEFICNMGVASQVSCFQQFGLTSDSLNELKGWVAAGDAVTLRFRSEEKCTFLRTETREEDSGVEQVTEGSLFGTISSKVITKIKEYFWKVEVSWEVVAFRGVGVEVMLRLNGRKGEHVIKTTSDIPPQAELISPSLVTNLDMTWFLTQLDKTSLNKDPSSFSPSFKIDRNHINCATPSQNPDIISALNYVNKLVQFCTEINRFIHKMINKLDASSIKSLNTQSLDQPDLLFVPILPMFQNQTPSFDTLPISSNTSSNNAQAEEEVDKTETTIAISFKRARRDDQESGSNVLLDISSVHKFLNEEARLLATRVDDLKQEFPTPTGVSLVSSNEATLVMVCGHMKRVCSAWSESIAFIENMLRSQLIAAIGHEVTPTDFDNYMSFHNNKFFTSAYKPKPMVHSIRRSHLHSPEGTLSVERMSASSEASTESNANKPIETFCSSRTSLENDMGFSINAATRICFSGERHLHGWLRHDFSNANQSSEKISLNARARQFSGFIVIVGRLLDANNIDPQHAFLVQNRDEVEIPLSVSTIPTAKEFKDSIQSLSPEQQRFAKAFREMQLGATLMGVLVIQIKPQLEAVLDLPPDSLTKEIKLTKDLFSLFIDYQIPSDLLKYSTDESANLNETVSTTPTAFKVAAVKGHVASMLEMVSEVKKEEIIDQFQSKVYDDLGSAPPQMMTRSAGKGSRAMMSMSAGGPPPRGPPAGRAPPPQQQLQQQPQSMMSQNHVSNSLSVSSTSTSHVENPNTPIDKQSALPSLEQLSTDFSCIPAELDSRALELDQAIRPTIVKPSDTWKKKAGAALVANKKGNTTSAVELGSEEQRLEKDRAFDLLDGLTRSGCLPLSHTTLHVIVCATLSFDDSVVDTVVKKNVNPIERAERSSMVMAGTVHGLDRHESSPLVNQSMLARVTSQSPLLFSSSVQGQSLSQLPELSTQRSYEVLPPADEANHATPLINLME